MHIHSRTLQYFDMIRRCSSIREAARRLHVASSAVNRQLLQLEDELGTQLFERMSSGLKLTAAGEVFSQHVITVLQDQQRLLHELEALKGIRRGELSVMSVEGLNASFLPHVLKTMMTRYPTIEITVRSAGSAQTAQVVIDGEADVAIGFSLDRSAELRQCAVGRFGLGAIMRPDHPLASQEEVSFADCARYPLILAGPELSVHATMRAVIAHHKKPTTVLLRTGSIELAKALAMDGVGIAFQTRIGLERELQEKRIAHVYLKAQPNLVTELGVYVRAGRMLPPPLDAFIRILAEEIENRAAEESFR
jgi:DNA-binding transcriptional LysR family regulator